MSALQLDRRHAVVIATHNSGKHREIAALLERHGIAAQSAADHGVPEPAETGATFAENALLKARHAAAHTGLPALGDDSGLCVRALDGAPGLLSARWAGVPRDFGRAMRRVRTALEMTGTNDRRARFVCALALATPEGNDAVFSGEIDGTLVWPPRGENGFGYDPMFQPDGHAETFGQMTAAHKQSMDHRARAFAALARACLPRACLPRAAD